MTSSKLLGFILFAGIGGTAATTACSGDNGRSGFGDVGAEGSDGGDGGTGFGGADSAPKPACIGRQCDVPDCGVGGDTTVTGTVFAPNGKIPLYNAIVYVPNAEIDPLPKGVQCDKCGAVSGSPVTTTISDSGGKFTLKGVPAGKNIPLVIQIGKWRRQVSIPEVKGCSATALTDPELTRLPKKQSEGNMPHIALTSGGCDNLGCMLPKVGIDPSEFGKESDGDAKAVHVYLGSGGQGPAGSGSAATFWNDVTRMKNYDMMVLSCECSEQQSNKTAAFGPMTEYLKAGGRIFTTDFMYTWYKFSPDNALKTVGTIPGGAPIGVNPMDIDSTFPKGQALKEWMTNVFPASVPGKVQCDVVFDNVFALDKAKAQQWTSSGPPHPRVFTVNLPVDEPADKQCGKGVHLDAHVNQGGGDAVNASYPASCPNPLKPAEGMFAFFFFDLASCIQKENEPPKPPPVK